MLTTLKEDFLRLPELLAHAAPQPGKRRPRRRPRSGRPGSRPSACGAGGRAGAGAGDPLAPRVAALDESRRPPTPEAAPRRRAAGPATVRRPSPSLGVRRSARPAPVAAAPPVRRRAPVRTPRAGGRARSRGRPARRTGAARPLLDGLAHPRLAGADAEARARAGRLLRPPALVTVEGDLGTGKTTLVREVLRARGVRGAVTSPSFTLAQSYHGRERRAAAPPRPVPAQPRRRRRAVRLGRLPRAGRDHLRRVAGGRQRRAAAGRRARSSCEHRTRAQPPARDCSRVERGAARRRSPRRRGGGRRSPVVAGAAS